MRYLKIMTVLVLATIGVVALSGELARAQTSTPTPTNTPLPTAGPLTVTVTPTAVPYSQTLEEQVESGANAKAAPMFAPIREPAIPAVELPEVVLPEVPVFKTLDLPDTLNLPAWPQFAVPAVPEPMAFPNVIDPVPPQLPDTLNLPAVPSFPVPDIPASNTLPAIIDLKPMTFPTSLNLPDPPTLTVNIPQTTTLPGEDDMPDRHITETSTGLLASFNPVITRAKQLNNDTQSYLGDIESMTLADYTAEQMAAEMVLGMDTTMSYMRAIGDIGVLGPTAMAIIIGLGWITFVSFSKLAVKTIFMLVDVIVRIVEIIATVVGIAT
jgi:hypothetical protein